MPKYLTELGFITVLMGNWAYLDWGKLVIRF